MGSLNIEYPNIPSGTAETQLGHIKSYLYQLTEKLNLADFSAEKIFEDVSKAIDAESVATESNEETAKLKEYANLKALIIKTGDYAVRNSPELEKVFESSFGASSNFGKYFETLKNEVTENAEGIKQLFTYTAGINNENGDFGIGTKQFIKSGLLYYDDNQIPVFGVGVGVISTIADDNGEIIDLDQNRLATFAADEIAFWDQGTKVAYIRDNAINFPAANIRGGSIHIGQEENNFFKVDVDGNLTIGDNFSVDNAGIAKFKSADGKTTLDLSAGDISFEIDNEIHMKQSADGITFNKLEGGGGLTVFKYIGGISAYLNADIGSGLYPTARMSIFDVYDPSSSKVLGKLWDNGGTKSQLDIGGVYLRDSYDMNTEYAAFYTETGKSYLWTNDLKIKSISGIEIAGLGISDSGNAELLLGSPSDGLWTIAEYDGERHVHADHFHFHNKSDGLITGTVSTSECSAYIVIGQPTSGGYYSSITIPAEIATGRTWQIADENCYVTFTISSDGTVSQTGSGNAAGSTATPGSITTAYSIR